VTSVRETHIGVVLFLGDHAYKFKKPVRTDFLDFGTRERRARACHREVELNRRLAPDAYLGVGELGGPDGGTGEPVVVMRRMPDERRLSAIVGDGRSGSAEVRQVARVVATFHAGADRSAEVAAAGTRDAVRQRWDGVLGGLRAAAGRILDRDAVLAIDTAVRRFLRGREPLFAGRVDAGRIVDGHGDLLAEDVFMIPDGPQILDCLEFDDQLRHLDGLDDAAFLAMDLEYHGRPDLARAFLGWYAEFAGDPAPEALRHHYLAYRAAVRARVACLRAEQEDPGPDDPEPESVTEAHRYAELARRHLDRAAVRLVMVGGLPGTGKSTVAAGLADRVGLVLLSSDRLRKELAGLDPEQAAAADYRSGLYAPEHTRRVYGELLARAEALLGQGESVLLDASWAARADRERAAELAERTVSDLVALRCSLPEPEAARRLAERTGTASDADRRIAESMAADADPWPEAHELRTDRPADEVVAGAAGVLGYP
jgi:aminoglycoside phosphotransferase family enzyme/predicted kinase